MADQGTRYALREDTSDFDEEKGVRPPTKNFEEVYIPELPLDQFDDPNLGPKELLANVDKESPYPEVRSAVANTDDFDMPAATLRTWLIGLVWAIAVPGPNQFFFFRLPQVTIGGIVAQLLSFPMGCAAAAWLPNVTIFGAKLNPGPFTIMVTAVGSGSAYATNIIAVRRVTYNQSYNFSYQWFVVMSTQLIGFSIGGIARRFLVAPPSMIWLTTLVNCTLLNTFHSQKSAGIGARGGLSRERFFVNCTLHLFVDFIPGYPSTLLFFLGDLDQARRHIGLQRKAFGVSKQRPLNSSGAIAPIMIIPWALSKKWPKSIVRYINVPLLLAGTNSIPPANAINFVRWARILSWWIKYNYVLSAALDTGLAVSILVIFFTLQYPKDGTIGADTVQSWWGNTVPFVGADGMGTPIKTLAPGETFGPSTW